MDKENAQDLEFIEVKIRRQGAVVFHHAWVEERADKLVLLYLDFKTKYFDIHPDGPLGVMAFANENSIYLSGNDTGQTEIQFLGFDSTWLVELVHGHGRYSAAVLLRKND